MIIMMTMLDYQFFQHKEKVLSNQVRIKLMKYLMIMIQILNHLKIRYFQ